MASVGNLLYIYLFLEYPLSQTLMLMGFVLVGGTVGPITLLQVNVRNARRNEIESQITEDLLAIAKENSLFAQRLWVFRKRWLLILHGSVQSSLTAALTRLQKAQTIDPVVLELVKQDLHRAEVAVESNLNDELDLDAGLKELQDVWAGICDIKIQVSERANRALQRSHDSSFCVNEIVKEAVSNAVRHGDATSVEVKIDRVADDLLHISVTNNGSAPVPNGEPGIGSEMLNEICLSWKLFADKNLVHLVAELPVKL
jgi:signal transduction histidine kinase